MLKNMLRSYLIMLINGDLDMLLVNSLIFYQKFLNLQLFIKFYYLFFSLYVVMIVLLFEKMHQKTSIMLLKIVLMMKLVKLLLIFKF